MLSQSVPVIKPRSYISPSALSTWDNCQWQFYQYYLAGNPFIRTKSSYAACLGSYFDGYIKDYLVRQRGMNRPDLNLTRQFSRINPDTDVDVKETKAQALLIAKQYIKLGCAKQFLEASSLDLEREIYVNYGGTPILGVVDAVVDGIPFDWKLRGFTSKTSPTPGYYRRITSEGVEKEAYKTKASQKIAENMKLENTNRGWATQMLIYNWLLERTVDYKAEIHEIISRPTTSGGSGFEVCFNRTKFSYPFVHRVNKDLQALWLAIQGLDIEIEEPHPELFKCEKYGSVCAVAAYCSPYLKTYGDKDVRRLL